MSTCYLGTCRYIGWLYQSYVFFWTEPVMSKKKSKYAFEYTRCLRYRILLISFAKEESLKLSIFYYRSYLWSSNRLQMIALQTWGKNSTNFYLYKLLILSIYDRNILPYFVCASKDDNNELQYLVISESDHFALSKVNVICFALCRCEACVRHSGITTVCSAA